MKLTKMAFESNDLKGILILVLFAIPMIASTNINCSGKAFHCVNSTHFMICVDLGGGVSTTIDDFVIPCPATTVCHENNVFECDFPEVTTPPLQVIGVYKPSDTSELTSVTSSVTAPTPSSEIFSVFKENITATTLSIPEDETPVVKLEVLEDIKNPVGVNSDNTREASYKVTSTFIDNTNEVVNDKQTSNNTLITTSATDNNKNLEPVETSTNKPANTSSTDKSKSIDTVTAVIGLINLTSTDLPSAVNAKPSSGVLTSLETLYDNIYNTTEQYITKQVTIHGEKVESVTEKIIIPTEIIFNERSATTDKVSTTPVVNMYIESDIKNTTEFNNTIDNQTNAVGNSIGKSNNKSEIVPETTTEYLAPINIINIFEPVTVDLSPHTTTDNTFVPLRLVDFIVDDTKQNAPSTNDYINTDYGDTATTTTDQYTTKLETTLSDKPVTAEVISTTPIVNTIYQNVFKNEVNNNSLTELNSTVEITSTKKVPETNINYFIPEPISIGRRQTTTDQTFVPITAEANVMYTTEMSDLIKNDSLVEKHTTATQPLEIIITTESPIEPTHNLYQINREINQKQITEKKYSASTTITTDRADTMFNASSTDIINNQVTEITLLPSTIMKNLTIELTTAETLHNGLTAHAIEAENEVHATNAPIIVDERYVENVKNDTLLYNMTNTMNTIETVKTVFNASSTDIITRKSIEPSTIKYPTIEISTAETLQDGFTAHAMEAKNELLATNGPISVNEAILENVGNNTLLSGHTTPVPYNVASDLVTNTTRKDLISQSDIVTNPQVGFTAEIMAHKTSDGSASIDHETTQSVKTDPETKIPGYLNQSENLGIVSLPENLNADHLNKTAFDKDVVGMTTSYWKNVENSAITPFPSDVTGKTSLSDSVKSINQDNISATNIVKDVLIKTILPQIPSTIYYVSELASTTPITVQTTPISIDTIKVSEQVSSYTPEIVDIYRVSTTDYKYDSSTSLPVDVTHKRNIENVTDIPVTTLPPQGSTSKKIGTVKQLNTTSTTTGTVSDLVPSTVTTAGYIVLNTTNRNTINWKDLVNIDIGSSKVDPHADVLENKTESVKPINGKNGDNTTSPSSTIKDENITIVSVFDIVNSSVNAMPNATLQPTISNPSLSNIYIETTESQYSSAYVNATDNVPDYNLEQVGESVIQKNPEGIVTFAQTNVVNSILSTPNTYTIPITEINTEKVQYVGTEAPLPSTLELKHINPTKTAVHNVTEKTNDYISAIEAIPIKLNNMSKAETEFSVSAVRSVTPSTAVTPDGFTTVPVYDEVTTIKDSAFIMSTTQTSPKVVTDNIKTISTESPLLPKVMETQTVKNNTESSLPISDLEPVAQMITEPTHTSNVLGQTTPLDKMDQDDVLTGIITVDLPEYVMSTLNNSIPQPMASLPIVGVTAAQITTEPTHTTKVFSQTTPLLAAAGRTNLNQGVIPETTDLPQNVLSTVNKNIPQSKPLLPIVGLTARQTTTEPTYTTNEFAQAAAVKTNQDVLPAIKPTDFSLSMMSTVNNNISQSMESLPIAEVTGSQITTEPTHTTNVFSQTTPLSAASGNTNQDVPSGIKTTDLPQYEAKTITYNSTQSISDITTETVTDSITDPYSMVETIKVVGYKVSGTYPGDTTLSNANYSLKSVKNIIDHESIVIGSSSKNNAQNTPITSATSVDFNRAEILNLTESNLMRSDVNIDSVKEEEDSISSVIKSGTDVENKTLLSDSSIISKIEPKNGIPVGRLTTVTTNYKEAESGAPESVTQLKTIITKENVGIDSSMNANIEIMDVKKYQFQVDSKNISDSYNINNTKANITTSHNNLSLQKSTINDELEQHLISTNHTVTTEVQSHLNESDKQSNKTSDELIFNGTSMLNPNHTSIKLSEGSNVTSTITVTALGFNCSNHTRGKYADKKDCRKFYTCLGNLQPMLGKCPNNTVFSEINKQCTRNLSHCVRNNQFRCLVEGRFSDFFKDTIYYICVKTRMNGFIRYKLQCQDDYHINKDLVKCEKNKEISTQESSVSETNNDDESNPQPKSEKIVSADDFVCKNEGKFPYVKDCSKYYVCDEIKNVYYICVKNRMNGFIRYKLQCQGGYHLNKDTVECEKNEEISTQSASSVTETNNDESKPNPKLETIVSTDDFECENEGKFPNAKDCNKYYVCTKIKNVYRRKIKKCAIEEVFDRKKKMCVESDSGEC